MTLTSAPFSGFTNPETGKRRSHPALKLMNRYPNCWRSVRLLVNNDAAPVLTFYSSVVPMPLNQLLNPNDSIRSWLTATLPLVAVPVPDETQVVQTVSVPVVTAAHSRKPKNTGGKSTAGDLAAKGRSPKSKATTSSL